MASRKLVKSWYDSQVYIFSFNTSYNTEISSNFLVWKFCGNAVSTEFLAIRPMVALTLTLGGYSLETF